jgi:hypothetical protein
MLFVLGYVMDGGKVVSYDMTNPRNGCVVSSNCRNANPITTAIKQCN